MTGVPPNPRRGRQRVLISALHHASLVVGVLASAALVLPGEIGTGLAWTVIAIVTAVPLVRVAWLGVRWARLGDRRFAAVAVTLLVVVSGGSLLAT